MNLDLFKPLLTAAARHLMTGLGGSLVALGALQPNQSTEFVDVASGLAVWAVGYAWSAWQKHKQEAAKTVAFTSGAVAQAAATATPLDPSLY